MRVPQSPGQSGSGSAAIGSVDLTIEVVRHDSVDPNDDAIGTVFKVVELFAEGKTEHATK